MILADIVFFSFLTASIIIVTGCFTMVLSRQIQEASETIRQDLKRVEDRIRRMSIDEE